MAKDISEPTPNPETGETVSNLKDLEQHISERISQLGPTAGEAEPDFFLDLPPLEGHEPDFIPETDSAAFGSGASRTLGWTPTLDKGYVPPYLDNNMVLRNLHDLSDLLTESIVKINLRLNSIEEKLSSASNKKPQEVDRLIKELKSTLHGGRRADSGEEAIDQARMLKDIEARIMSLDDRLERGIRDVQSRVDDRHTALRDKCDTEFGILRSTSIGNKAYLNKIFFYLGLLLVLGMIIAGALVTNSIDRMGASLSEQMDELRARVEQAAQTKHHEELFELAH